MVFTTPLDFLHRIYMSIAAQLALNEASLRDANVRLLNMCLHASASDILDDPEYKKPELLNSSRSEFNGLSLYQLNEKLQDTESFIDQLNALWLTKSLIQEIQMTFNPVDNEDYICDNDELYGILQNLKKLKARVATLASEDLAIGSALQACSHDLIKEFAGKLKSLLLLYIPTDDDEHFIINDQIEVNESTFAFSHYVSMINEYESFASAHDVTEELSKKKVHWDRSILDKLIHKKNYLHLESERSTYTIVLTQASTPRKFLSKEYFQSLRNFVSFINVLQNQSFKNYYSTKISNNLAEMVSENIKTFMDNKQQLTEELVETLDYISRSGWNMPIRNTFNSLDRIQEGLLSLYVGWITDKYINEIRDICNSSTFETNLTLLKDAVEDSRQSALVEERDDWNESWGSDDDDDAGGEATGKTADNGDDDWDEDWDNGWDDDEQESTMKPKKLAKTSKAEAQNAHILSLSTDMSIKYSQLPFKFSIILAKFAKETNNADPQDILDTIGALSILSYPALTDLFLLLNDLQRIKAGSNYLSGLAEEEWNHVKQQLFDEITTIITGIDFSNRDLTPDFHDEELGMNKGSSRLKQLLAKQFEKDLPKTNTELFKVFIMELLNFINNLVLEIIISSDEITEYQSEKFTKFLESLQQWETECLAKVGEDSSKLASYNKTKQAVTLINSHLKDIMEYFYQGELYDFTTEEMIKVIKSVFVPSDLRENCIGDIIEIRNS